MVDGLQIYFRTDDSVVGRALLRDRVWEPLESSLLGDLITPGMIVADIGAHVGYYTLLAAQLVGSAGRVFAFEPDHTNLSLLRHNVSVNGFDDRVEVMPFAVADKPGRRRLFRDEANLGNHSLAEKNVPAHGSFIEVETVTLQSALAARGHSMLDFVKIDVQGAEGLVFAGGRPLFETGSPKCLMELWPTGLRNLGVEPELFVEELQRMNFSIYAIHGVDRGLTVIKDASRFLASLSGPLDQANLLLEKTG